MATRMAHGEMYAPNAHHVRRCQSRLRSLWLKHAVYDYNGVLVASFVAQCEAPASNDFGVSGVFCMKSFVVSRMPASPLPP